MDHATLSKLMETKYEAAAILLRDAADEMLEASLVAAEGNINQAQGAVSGVDRDLAKAMALLQAISALQGLRAK